MKLTVKFPIHYSLQAIKNGEPDAYIIMYGNVKMEELDGKTDIYFVAETIKDSNGNDLQPVLNSLEFTRFKEALDEFAGEKAEEEIMNYYEEQKNIERYANT